MGSVSLRLVKVCRQIFWSCRFLSKVNMVVVKVQAKKVTGPVASSLPVTVRDTERDRAREAAASRLVQTHSMVATTVMLLVMSLTLLSLANFRETQISLFINGPTVPEVTVWYRVPMAMLWISVESKREETTGEIVKKLETEVFESNMDEDEMVEDEDMEEEDMEANMETAFEETVKEEVENNNREDKIME